ncbi:ABC transporter permease [Larkinella terrae]|uniref:FtsX-like permease family protein n=1 Tax=Larkinella terrae TaxID=2025311 RepID=A0A7K0EQY8_9BACT|nr:ABC transporter permease [Larkinella terrae]MRS64245.1 FtsX-like permease family protein [Larkinella terrae]
MLQNYIKIAWRSLLKNRLYSFINIFGLALGMSCSLLVGLWVNDELSYDRFLPHLDDIYYVRTNSVSEGKTYTGTLTPGPVAGVLKRDVPEIQYATKVQFPEEKLIKVGEKSTKEKGFFATKDFFLVFDFPAIAGSPLMAHAKPDQIIVTRKIAEKFFGTTNAVGKRLHFDNTTYYTVGAVLEDIPRNSSLRFDWLINYDVQEQDWKKTWGNFSFLTYVRLDGKATQARAEANMKPIFRRNTDWKEAPTLVLQPMKEVYLYAEYEDGKAVGGRIEYVRIFALVSVFILLIACVNFMNLATARSAGRAKEVGVRKVVGALRSSLIGQFISESVLTSLLAVLLSLAFVLLVLPTFNAVFAKQLTLNLANPVLWAGMLALVLITGFVSGSYPALFLSSLQPIRILKGTLKFGVGAALFRRALVIFQFTLSIFLIIGMLAVEYQMDYIRTINLGLDRENVLYVPLENETYKRMEVFRQELIRTPSIASASASMSLPMNIEATSGDLTWPGKKPDQGSNVSTMSVGYDFLKTMNIRLVDGRDFSSDRKADSASYIINEAAAKMMGMKNPVGKQVGFWMGKGPIIGVMKDFHLQSLHSPITPLVLTLIPVNTSYLLVRPEKGKTAEAIAELERATKDFNPDYPFEYHFLDDAYERMYRSEQQVNTLINYFGTLAILISCLGLFALAAFTAEQRKKEIGVRKVLGASVGSLVALTSKDFLKLVVVAMALASPLAWWAVSKWLETFQYSVQLSWWLFVTAGVLACLIAFLTVSYQSVKAALTNPVTSLRSE